MSRDLNPVESNLWHQDTVECEIDAYLKSHTPVDIFYSEDTGKGLWAVCVHDSDFWLGGFDTVSQAMNYAEMYQLPVYMDINEANQYVDECKDFTSTADEIEDPDDCEGNVCAFTKCDNTKELEYTDEGIDIDFNKVSALEPITMTVWSDEHHFVKSTDLNIAAEKYFAWSDDTSVLLREYRYTASPIPEDMIEKILPHVLDTIKTRIEFFANEGIDECDDDYDDVRVSMANIGHELDAMKYLVKGHMIENWEPLGRTALVSNPKNVSCNISARPCSDDVAICAIESFAFEKHNLELDSYDVGDGSVNLYFKRLK